jgi:NAD-dependent dihydropyrimidine dehydrogenase PreA subunit
MIKVKEADNMPVTINKDLCIACGACAGGCPVGALTVEDVAVCDPDVCIDCGACVATCPVEAISQ